MFRATRDRQDRLKLASPALFAGALLLAILIINPIREMTWNDDAWAYARMVQHLLATGRYQLDPWAAANMPVQTYLAAALAKVVGYSLSLLRCTTLALLATALFSFYALLRELGHTRPRATIITLALLASPLVLILGFTFMSDVQFLGWFVLSLWLYVRGTRRRSARSIFLASLAAGCAIGTRQFGMAIVVGIVITWALAPRDKRPPVRLLLLGIIVPLIAATGQLFVGFRAPNITQIHRLAESREMFTFPAAVLLKELFWRFCVVVQYAGMSALPLLPIIFSAPRAFWKQRVVRIPLWTWALLSAAVIVAALCISSSITARPEARHHGLWEPLELYWELPRNLEKLRPIMRLLDLAGIIGAASLFAIVLSNLRGIRSLRSFAPETIFLSNTALCLLVLHLFYRQLCDTYIIPLIPFVLLLVASHLRNFTRSQERKTLLPLSAGISLVAIVGMSLWIRGEYESTTAIWAALESLTYHGAQKWDIAAESTWLKYHGSFSEWVAAGHPGYDVNHRERYPSPLDDPFFSWEREHLEHPTYCVVLAPTPEPPAGWQLVSAIRYRNQIFTTRYALALKRDSSGQ
jgi:hypothetical protein